MNAGLSHSQLVDTLEEYWINLWALYGMRNRSQNLKKKPDPKKKTQNQNKQKIAVANLLTSAMLYPALILSSPTGTAIASSRGSLCVSLASLVNSDLSF
jgi:hypothetical protein